MCFASGRPKENLAECRCVQVASVKIMIRASYIITFITETNLSHKSDPMALIAHLSRTSSKATRKLYLQNDKNCALYHQR